MQGMELSAPCVLIVSDAPERGAALKRHVEPMAVVVHDLPHCHAAIERSKGCDTALIVLDLQLPMMDGFEAVRQLRNAPRTAHVPIIMIADGRVGMAERKRGQSLGAVAYLQRQDLDFDALQEQIRMLLELHVRANGLQLQIDTFLDQQARLSISNPQIRAMQPGLHRHLLTDLLTGLPNRMFFDLHLAALIRRGARGGRGFSLVWIDLDHLSRVNDRYQRAVGDQMLVTIAQRLEAVVRSSDVLARVEGDTYGLILDDVGESKAVRAALNKVLAVAGEPLEATGADGQSVTLIPTLSVGVACYPRHGEDQVTLMGVAQQAAQEVLRLGGDGVRIGWDPPQPATPLKRR